MKKLTAIIIIVTFLALVIYDVYAWLRGGEGATISEVYLHWLEGRPWLLAAPFYLLGHLTWPQLKPIAYCPHCSCMHCTALRKGK